MTEKEKMLAEKWYDANFDQDLINERARAKDICNVHERKIFALN